MEANLCLDRGLWHECAAAYRWWEDQIKCEFAEKKEHKNQCRWLSECGFCQCTNAYKTSTREK